MIKRIVDFFLAILLFFVFMLPMAAICIVIKITSPGRALFWSRRVGKDNKIFLMPKFRTMKVGTP